MVPVVTCPPEHKHNASCYVNHKCRCQKCRADHAAGQYRRRRKRDPSTLPPEAHGNPSTYTNWQCRCKKCTKAQSDAKRAYAAKRRKRDT